MPIEFERFNNEYEAANPGDPSHVDTGRNSATSIERINNNEDADQEVFRRPSEQLRRRTAHLAEEINAIEHFNKSVEGRFIDFGSTTVVWEGTGTGIFELSGSIQIRHPMYPETFYEVTAATIGNSGTGFFFTEGNRLLEDGDSIWITWGDTTGDAADRDAVARDGNSAGITVTQSQLRKGPTWVLLEEQALDLSAEGIVVGSDIVRVYPDPSTLPSYYTEHTIRDVVEDPVTGYWYVEVAHDDAFFDLTNAGDEIPPLLTTNKLSRLSNGAEYTVLDSSGTTTRIAQRSFQNYFSNLMWFKKGLRRPYRPNGTTVEYRENEWQFAVPLAMVSNGQLYFPLSSGGGIPASSGNNQSISGYMRTSQSDNVFAGHNFLVQQNFFQDAGGTQFLRALIGPSNAITPGRGEIKDKIEEASVDGTGSTPIYWLSPARPSRWSIYGNHDGSTNPFARLTEQGFYTAGGAESYEEATLELKLPGQPGTPTLLSSNYSELRASQALYTMKADNFRRSKVSTEFLMQSALFTGIAGNGTGISLGHVVLGTLNDYRTAGGRVDVHLEGTFNMVDVFSAMFNLSVPDPVSTLAEANTALTQSLSFSSRLRLEPVTGSPTSPMVQSGLVKSETGFAQNRVLGVAAPTDPTTAGSLYEKNDTFYSDTLAVITAENGSAPGISNTLYPNTPNAGGITLAEGLFSSDLYTYIGTGPYTTAYRQDHSQVRVSIVGYPSYNGVSSEHRLNLYLQWEFHTEDDDASEADRLRNLMYIKEFKNALDPATYGINPRFVLDSQATIIPVWDEAP